MFSLASQSSMASSWETPVTPVEVSRVNASEVDQSSFIMLRTRAELCGYYPGSLIGTPTRIAENTAKITFARRDFRGPCRLLGSYTLIPVEDFKNIGLNPRTVNLVYETLDGEQLSLSTSASKLLYNAIKDLKEIADGNQTLKKSAMSLKCETFYRGPRYDHHTQCSFIDLATNNRRIIEDVILGDTVTRSEGALELWNSMTFAPTETFPTNPPVIVKTAKRLECSRTNTDGPSETTIDLCVVSLR
jgi:hypothetical protein